MAAAFHYRPRFIDIRVRPPKADEEARAADVNALKPGERACDRQGCGAAAVVRAPKSRALLDDHYWFCRAHAADYNRTWDFFAGMSEGEIRARMADEAATGGRPTWSFKGGTRNREAASHRGFSRDPFGIFGGSRAREDEAAADRRRLGRLERGALADLDLDATAEGPAIRARYTEMVKRCHPDANGGDRSAEHKLQRVIKAYKTLQKARIV
ncbi:MAG: J domain-containing protein [Caulobacteraceae bacterium]